MPIMRIGELRRARGISQQYMGNMLGVSQTTVSIWEREEALPGAEKLPRIAALLGTDVTGLFVETPGRLAYKNSQKE